MWNIMCILGCVCVPHMTCWIDFSFFCVLPMIQLIPGWALQTPGGFSCSLMYTLTSRANSLLGPEASFQGRPLSYITPVTIPVTRAARGCRPGTRKSSSRGSELSQPTMRRLQDGVGISAVMSGSTHPCT
jgi:hypothetical protein